MLLRTSIYVVSRDVFQIIGAEINPTEQATAWNREAGAMLVALCNDLRMNRVIIPIYEAGR